MDNIAVQRLYNQQLEQTKLQTPNEVVAWLGAVQAQEYAYAKWALGLRLEGITDAEVEQAFTEGSILRTHVMRPTWHFVTPADIRWILALTAPRVHAVNGYMYRQLELDDALFVQSDAAIVKALEGGQQLTRPELGAVLEQVGIVADGMRLGYIVHHAELDALVCSGARRGKQFTYALLEERAPHAKMLSHDEALAELTRRYFTSHGPAMIQDFAWWSGLTTGDVKAGLEMAKPSLVQTVIDHKTYWHSPAVPNIDPLAAMTYFLPPYDEIAIAYRDHTLILNPVYNQQANSAVFGGAIMIQGQVVGNWKRVLNKGTMVIEFAPYRPFTPDEKLALETAAQRYRQFLQMPVNIKHEN